MNNRCIFSVRFDSSSVVLLEGASCVEELMGSRLYANEFASKNRNEEGKTWRTGLKERVSSLLAALLPTLYFNTH